MITPNMGIIVWDQGDDKYDHIQLASNFTTLDAHDHTLGRGKRITTLAIQDLAVTTAKIADLAVTAAKFANGSVTNVKLADNAVDTRVIAAAGVGTIELADRSVTSIKLADAIRPLGEVITWWRPTTATPLPEEWVPCDGRQLTAPNHDFAGGGTITVPNLINKFVLGASTGATGTGPTTPPAIGQSGGSNVANLSHTHTVPHGHTVDAHTHGVNPHSHVVNAHTHGMLPHAHSVEMHSHPIGPHTHTVSPHIHTMDHQHTVAGHSHGISGDGHHAHTFAGGFVVASRRSYIYGFPATQTEDRQTLYLNGFNSGGTSATAHMDGAGGHSHGGSTHYADAFTYSPNIGTTGWAGSTAEPSAAFNSGETNPATNAVGGETTSSAPATSSVSGSTAAASPGTSFDAPATSAGLTSEDVRPAYVGLLYLVKVKN